MERSPAAANSVVSLAARGITDLGKVLFDVGAADWGPLIAGHCHNPEDPAWEGLA